jgi:hypothetical protein
LKGPSDREPENTMLYALLIYERPHDFDRREDDAEEVAYTGAWQAWHKALLEANAFAGGAPLHRPETGTTVRQRDSKRLIQDGPYANTKEQLGGFTLLELPSLDAALEWAARCPAAAYGAVEVRPIATEVHKRVTGEEPEYGKR